MFGAWVVRLGAGVLLITALVVGGTGFRVWQVARTDDRTTADIVVVLGAAQYDGRPSSILEARLEHAKRLYEQGVAPMVVTVGGRRTGDTFTEAQAGRNYLIAEAGLPDDKVLAVDTGADTLGSLRAVADVARERGWDSAIVVTDPWHSLRARTMARDAGLAAWTSPTRQGPAVRTRQTQARYILRETAAMVYYRLTHAPAETPGTGVG
ncbi:MAG TPA: YdcF family protein [Pseudonocardiaceae bacterium]